MVLIMKQGIVTQHEADMKIAQCEQACYNRREQNREYFCEMTEPSHVNKIEFLNT